MTIGQRYVYIEISEWIPLALSPVDQIRKGPEGYGDYQQTFEVDKKNTFGVGRIVL